MKGIEPPHAGVEKIPSFSPMEEVLFTGTLISLSLSLSLESLVSLSLRVLSGFWENGFFLVPPSPLILLQERNTQQQGERLVSLGHNTENAFKHLSHHQKVSSSFTFSNENRM